MEFDGNCFCVIDVRLLLLGKFDYIRIDNGPLRLWLVVQY